MRINLMAVSLRVGIRNNGYYPIWLVALYLFLFWLIPITGFANPYATEINNAQISVQNDDYLLSADLVYKLSDDAKQALQNGVPLFWDVQILLERPRNFLWNKTLATINIRYRIQYHALLNLYRVTIVQTPSVKTYQTESVHHLKDSLKGEVYNFSTLFSALDFMSDLRHIPLLKSSPMPSEKPMFAKIKVSFDRDALPLPLQPIAYLKSEWYLSSDWTLWPLEK